MLSRERLTRFILGKRRFICKLLKTKICRNVEENPQNGLKEPLPNPQNGFNEHCLVKDKHHQRKP